MVRQESVLGLGISGTSIQAVEIVHDGSGNTLRALEEWEGVSSATEGSEGIQLDAMVSHLGQFLSSHGVQAKRACIALDTSLMFINTVPLDDELSAEAMREHIHWELQQYFPDASPAEFISDSHVLTERKTEHWNEVLLVAIRRNHTRNIRKVLEPLKIDLHILDADHFSADTALRINYPDTARRYLALIGIKEHRVDVSLIRYGNMESYIYYTVRSNQEIIDLLGTLSREIKGLYSVTAYGPHLDRELLTQIRGASSLLVEALNPFRHVRIADSLRVANHLSVPSYRFAATVGVALRRD